MGNDTTSDVADNSDSNPKAESQSTPEGAALEAGHSSSASVLGARMAFMLDGNALEGMTRALSTNILPTIPQEQLLRIGEALTNASQVAFPSETKERLKSIFASLGDYTIPKETLENLKFFMGALDAGVSQAFSSEYFNQLKLTTNLLNESISVDSLYSPDQLEIRKSEQKTHPRGERTAEAFFDECSVEITDLRSFLKAFAVIQEKHHQHRLVWRGQQDATWAVHSSLYRKLESSTFPTEDCLVDAEKREILQARSWGQKAESALKFFADLQHYGAPTRFLDATVDPEIAAWFAVESHPELDDRDGRILAWGRNVRLGAHRVSEPSDELNEEEVSPFWHSWTDDEERGRVDWGTGSRTWSWFPPALSDRMRAQRAGFLIEAGPIVTPKVATVISDSISQDWRTSEITRATSIIGLPSRHDVLSKPNDANLVPMFSLRVTAQAKPLVRGYLESKGLKFSTVYPDLGGLVNYLNGPFGLLA